MKNWISLDNPSFCGLVPTDSEYMIKKKLSGYSRVPGSSDQKTDFGRFGEHPTYGTYDIILYDMGPYYIVHLIKLHIT